jgi:hypothetical protein
MLAALAVGILVLPYPQYGARIKEEFSVQGTFSSIKNKDVSVK